ncbi:3-oxoadipyl-CoA thiolase [Yunchengibacter salinarum]|uniref:3-oxoadipyl-CoA thiolase n=1 Tax=Yunchengibacter salinarum TaxID=3133399 RepID=UPI0035B5D1C0
MTHAFICDGIRTPVGRYAGALRTVRADDLAALPLGELKARNTGVDWDSVDDVILGCANQAGEDNRNIARMAGLLAGLGEHVPGTTINRLCGSGMDAIAMAARAIAFGDGGLMVAGGSESMSRAPFVMPKAEAAFSRASAVYDTTIGWRFVNPLMEQQYGIHSMPETAENVAEDYAVSREDQDAFAVRSQQRAAAAIERGFFRDEIMPVTVKVSRKETATVDADEHPRPGTSLDKLASLPTPFRENGCVTAGNASGVNDGAAAVIVASEEAAKKNGLTPKARVVGCAVAGVPPRIMGMGPAPATRKLLERTGIGLDQIGVVELNEAFAAQALAVLRDLGLPDDAPHVNANGGAIAIGHPLGMSGARLALTATRSLHETGERYALATMCIGVGQGIAMLLERV